MKKLENLRETSLVTLPTNLRKNGFSYTLVLRTGSYAIYEQHVNANLVYYEVFIIPIVKEKEIFGKKVEAHEKFPADEDFGKIAWIYRTFDRALYKLYELMGIEDRCIQRFIQNLKPKTN